MINKKIEKDTHRAILQLLYKRTGEVVYIRLIEEFYSFMRYNSFTYIQACHYFIDEYNANNHLNQVN